MVTAKNTAIYYIDVLGYGSIEDKSFHVWPVEITAKYSILDNSYCDSARTLVKYLYIIVDQTDHIL